MELNKVLYMYAATVALLLCSSANFIQSPSDVLGSVALQDPTPSAAHDFGAVVSDAPVAVMQPGSPADIARLLSALSSAGPDRRPKAAVAARGAGHSLHGQAQARGGIVVETRALPRLVEVVRRGDGDGDGDGGAAYADVGAGALWVEVLEECLRAGLAPRSWTDYLYLTVGGTLSNGGISGQAFKHGPQISNVLQLEVVTGTGEVVTCSPTQSPELFFAVLGGLGQFGIITRARIPLQLAPPKVRWVRAFYDSFETFTKDQELLVSMPELVDYVEGFVVLNEQSLRSSSVAFPAQVDFSPDFASGAGSNKVHYYCIEFAVHEFQQQDSAADHVVDLVSGQLSYLRPHAYSVQVAYLDFLNRVRMEEESLRSRGLWDVPHPWLNLFVPRHGVARFKDLLMDTITQGDFEFEGPVLVYPLLANRWDGNTSAVVPAAPDGVMYVFSVLRSTDPARCGRACVEGILEQHRRLADEACRRLGAKQYLARQPSPAHWRDHFGASWDRFVARKARFDPSHVLGPGQGIFPWTDSATASSV
ncbi:cytokinin dehydrogenase 8 [Zea mays]|uniref:cytokinin dehydrogenase n=3 Tax=Zea mays TaxID=4577 RepID=A0A1D6JAL0_MAIZE|nr:cytokinin dehydrogenase 8 [Zea mays]AQK44933.1 cytokinin oxidase11 [Zea mays]|eukprot:XP_008663392.2 cytokinin dehydrogenase 8 [Zea mays]